MEKLYEKLAGEITPVELLLLIQTIADAYGPLVSPDVPAPEFSGRVDIWHRALVEFGGMPLVAWAFDEDAMTADIDATLPVGRVILDRAITSQREALKALLTLRELVYGLQDRDDDIPAQAETGQEQA